MVHHLSLLGRQVEITVHLLIVERADAGRSQPERFRGEIQAMADGACFEMHIAITTVAMGAGGTIEIADHRERHACVTGEILPEAQARGRDALVAAFDLLQLGTLRPEPVHAGFQPVDAMGVQIELDEGQQTASALRMAESCVNDIDCVPPTKSSAERRVRATSPKERSDVAGGGSLISPEPVGAGSTAELTISFRGAVNPVNARVSGSFFRELIRVPAVPNGLADIGLRAALFPRISTISIGHSSSLRRQARAISSSGKSTIAVVSHPMARAASASACQACPMSCRQYR